ncbi:MAG TPA: glycoside hydrolase family 3 C-terminal domain-containing protein, partial [Candidatus Baltobacteraceae bacterium]|nr:glycoside hydrolase family 3 C-terminal domain-containing protein [Candidatus Baltobacteraceae bacterium]
MVTRRFVQMFKFGNFDYSKTQQPIPAKEHGAIARAIAEQSAVLLKNSDNILPLDAKAIHSIAVISRFANAALTGGSGSSSVKPLYTVTPLEGLTNLLGANVAVTYSVVTNSDEAAAVAKSADVALVIAQNRD